jgi:predicted nuclease of predicted toxin-antitoxin system
MKVLVDAMYDGLDIKLKELGYETYSVKKLIAEGKKLQSDYSIIKYAAENDIIVVTGDTEVGNGCKENDIPYVLIDNNKILKIILEELRVLNS